MKKRKEHGFCKGKKGIDLSKPGRTIVKSIKIEDIKLRKTSYPVSLKDREGVFVHLYKCQKCGLEFKLYSWKEFRHTDSNVHCPECGTVGGMVHNQKTITTRNKFSLSEKSEIYHQMQM